MTSIFSNYVLNKTPINEYPKVKNLQKMVPKSVIIIDSILIKEH